MISDRVADHIRRVVADAPPLTEEQRRRLAALLRPAVDAVNARGRLRGGA